MTRWFYWNGPTVLAQTGRPNSRITPSLLCFEKICGGLERSMVESFRDDYPQRLGVARTRVWAAYYAHMGDKGWIAQIPLRSEAD